jgi:hypothetical protein
MGIEARIRLGEADFASWAIKPPIPAYPICELGDKTAHPCLPHLLVLQVKSHSIDQESGEKWTAQADSQPIHHKSDSLLVKRVFCHKNTGFINESH